MLARHPPGLRAAVRSVLQQPARSESLPRGASDRRAPVRALLPAQAVLRRPAVQPLAAHRHREVLRVLRLCVTCSAE